MTESGAARLGAPPTRTWDRGVDAVPPDMRLARAPLTARSSTSAPRNANTRGNGTMTTSTQQNRLDAAVLIRGIVDAHGPAVRLAEGPQPALDQQGVGQDPAVQGGVVHLQAALQKQLLNVAVAE